MNINIRTFFVFATLFVLIITGTLIHYVNELHDASKKLKNIELSRYRMTLRADELRQSSDNLSKFANKYVITGDERYKTDYFKILNIRNGKAKRPLNYNSIYWNYSQEMRDKYHPLSKKISLKDEMSQLPYTPYEFEQLKNSEKNSNVLVNLEVEAFHAIVGLYKDANGKYTLKKVANQQLAITLINSKEYERAKEKIMLPIDMFLKSVKTRTNKTIEINNEKIVLIFEKIYLLLGLGILIFGIILILIYKKILYPISWLTNTILHFQKGDKDIKEISFYDDEVGLMIQQFFAMKKKMDDDYQSIKELALIDPLTGVSNRRNFFEIAESLLKLSYREKEPLSLMMIDIDNFKKINDAYGHLFGDEILILLVRNVQKVLRESDVFARFGGEEFIVLLPKTNKKKAFGVAEKVRKYIEDNPYIEDNLSIKFTISIGITESTQNDIEVKNLIIRADEALYEAKENGRNRTEVD